MPTAQYTSQIFHFGLELCLTLCLILNFESSHNQESSRRFTLSDIFRKHENIKLDQHESRMIKINMVHPVHILQPFVSVFHCLTNIINETREILFLIREDFSKMRVFFGGNLALKNKKEDCMLLHP